MPTSRSTRTCLSSATCSPKTADRQGERRAGHGLDKPVMADAWTPVCSNILLRPGDWLDRPPRGKRRGCAARGRDRRRPRHAREFAGPRKSASTKAKSSWRCRRRPSRTASSRRQEDDRQDRRRLSRAERSAHARQGRPQVAQGFLGKERRSRSARWWRTSTAATFRSPSAITR